jgi:hypothetical protein
MKEKIKKIVIIFVIIIAIGFLGYKIFGNKSEDFLPEQFIDDRTNFIQSVTLLREAGDLTQPPNGNSNEGFVIPKEQEQKIYSKIEEGLALSKKVDDVFLDYLNPDLKSYYRNKLILGNETYYEGIKLNNSGNTMLGVQKQIDGNNLIMEWYDWWAIHNEDLANKAYPQK